MEESKSTINSVRNSNIELLRIVAMFLVLIDHSGYMSINPPTSDEAFSAPLLTLARYGSQSFSSICVNVFVLISGWFGINSWWLNDSLQSYLVNTLLFDVAIFVVAIMLDKVRIKVWQQVKCLMP